MSASNIYMRLITATGPVIGEGLLEGWETSIELKSFGWGMEVRKEKEKNKLSLNSLANLVGLGAAISVQMQPLTFTKRFDVASSHIHFCLDHAIKVLSATITVLHIKPNVIPPHAPGFVLNAVDGYFEGAELEVSPDGNMAELTEVVTINFKAIQLSYMKPVNGQPLPTAPFFYPNPI
jgi:type VI protein secretion system component Hcp